MGGRGRNPVRPGSGQARDDRSQRSRQPRAGDQQALFPKLSGGGAGRDADHQERGRHQGVRQGAQGQHHPEAAAGIGRDGRVQARRIVQVQPQPDDRGDRPRRLHHRPGLCPGSEEGRYPLLPDERPAAADRRQILRASPGRCEGRHPFQHPCRRQGRSGGDRRDRAASRRDSSGPSWSPTACSSSASTSSATRSSK